MLKYAFIILLGFSNTVFSSESFQVYEDLQDTSSKGNWSGKFTFRNAPTIFHYPGKIIMGFMDVGSSYEIKRTLPAQTTTTWTTTTRTTTTSTTTIANQESIILKTDSTREEFKETLLDAGYKILAYEEIIPAIETTTKDKKSKRCKKKKK